MEFGKTYDFKEGERRIYTRWEESGFFNPDNLPETHKEPFTIIMPPPNANGSLHVGHALFVTLQDIVIRFHRMNGRRALWLPGADHAGFETQVVFDKKLEKEGRSRFQMKREDVWKEIWDFTMANKKIMENQVRRLGASCDWSREKFTLDEDIVSVVNETFKKMHDDGLVYRDLRVINWCTKHQTALSDLEVKYVEREDPLYYILYGPLTLATVRPETKFGDTALAVNLKDARYKKYIGKEIIAEGLLGKTKFKVIADEVVDPQFGTGVVKVTPAHDMTDFEIWTRHRGEIPEPISVIDERGRLTAHAGPYAGLKVFEARVKIVEALKEKGILQKIDEHYIHQIATCYKCGTVLEPLLRPQWFVAMTKEPLSGGLSLRDAATSALRKKEVRFITKRFEKIFSHWMKNLRDWNISRQIVWGIRIPAWYCDRKCPPTITTGKNPEKCGTCGSAHIAQDPDVFDTWFSSGQWPYATLMTTKSFDAFYPTSVMETGWDILFFWVARMIMLGIYRTGKAPFKDIYLHGLIRDKDRQKMSKSKGNVLDPLGVINEYGADALRMALVVGNTAGNDTVIAEDKIRGYRNFATKVWNIARFVMTYADNLPSEPAYSEGDEKTLKEFKAIKKEVTRYIETYKFHNAAETLYHYIWHTFADKIIEEAKPRLLSEDQKEKDAARALLYEILLDSLKLLHPFMPFLTEDIYERMPHKKTSDILMIEAW